MALSRSPRQYLGVRAILPPDLQEAERNPTSSDRAYVKGTLWLNLVGKTAWMWPGSGNWISLGSSTPENEFAITPFVAGPTGSAGYQTIQSAITACAAAGGGAVYVQYGTYTENLTIPAGVDIIGVNGPLNNKVIINGVHVPPTSGRTVFRNIFFESSGNVIASAGAGTTSFVMQDCLFNISGAIFSLPSWTSGSVEIVNCQDSGSTANTIASLGGTTSLIIKDCYGLGTGGTCTYAATGVFSLTNSSITSNFVLGGTDDLINGCDLTGTFTLSDNSSGLFTNNNLYSNTAQAITTGTGTSWTIANNVLDSSNATIVGGSGSNVLAGNVLVDPGAVSSTDNFYNPTVLSGIQAVQKPTTTTGADAWCGSVTLSGGTATVSTEAVFTGALIGLSRLSIGATGAAALGDLTVGTITNATSFVINSVQAADATALQATDVSVVFWWIIN